jgi:hypothetical protein
MMLTYKALLERVIERCKQAEHDEENIASDILKLINENAPTMDMRQQSKCP